MRVLTVYWLRALQEAFLTPSSVAIVLEHADAGDLSRYVASHCDPLVRAASKKPSAGQEI